jgi:hypothetical protein
MQEIAINAGAKFAGGKELIKQIQVRQCIIVTYYNVLYHT